MKQNVKDAAVAIVRRLRRGGFDAYFVGGCVRDMLMGKEPGEYDITTAAPPDEVARLFSRTVPVGRQFGVMLVVEEGHAFQVATFRADMEYRDGRKPSAVRFSSSAEEDVARRDFTVNGLLYDPLAGRLLDFVGGEADVRSGLIRAIGDPVRRFAEDKLRLLRAVRFSSTLGFRLEPGTLAAAVSLAREITVVSAERIGQELRLLMVGPRAGSGLALLDETGLLAPLLPEVDAMKGVQQPEAFHPEGDVFAHTIKMLNSMREPTVVLAFAVLLHDAGKPATRTVGDRVRFIRHQSEGAKIAARVCDRLRFPAYEKEMIVKCVENHMVFMEVKRMRESTLKRLMARPTFETELELHRLDCMASDSDLSAHEFLVKKRGEYGSGQIAPPRLLTGHDLRALGFAEGPAIGRILAQLEELQLENRLKTRTEALEWVKQAFPHPPDVE